MSDNMFRWDKDSDNVVVLTMDDPGGSANTLNDTFITSLEATLDRLDAEKDDIAGVIVTSAKKTFFAGADLNMIIQATPADAERLDAWKRWASRLPRRSMARRWAAVSRLLWPAITVWRSTSRAVRSDCLR